MLPIYPVAHGAAHEEAARRLAEAVEERMRLPVSFEPPAPVPANDLPPADDPPEEVYEDYPWAGRDRTGDADWIDDDRADGAEHDWLYQRRNGYADIYDRWSPEEVEQRRRSRIEREEEALHPRRDDGWTGPAGKKRTKKKKKKGRKSRTGDGPDRQAGDWFDSVEFPPGHDIA